ncbi:MAG: phosphatidate cytidylyltransferase [Candidatus Aminicenantales bacterium]
MSIRKRLPVALILLVFVVVCVQYLPRLGFFAVLQILIVITLLEFYNLSRKRKLPPQIVFGILMALIVSSSFLFEGISLEMALFVCLLLIGFYYVITINRLEKLHAFPSSVAITLLGTIYVSFTLNHFYLLREENGAFSIFFLLSVVFLGDTGAYVLGKLWGRRKFLPIASPRKTWEGCFGGIVFACLGAWAAQQILLPEVILWKAILCGFFVHVVAQISDPLESLFKRAAGVKDSSRLLLGHGGFLDRMDSLILAAPFFYYFIKYFWD